VAGDGCGMDKTGSCMGKILERRFVKAESVCRKTRTSWSNMLQYGMGLGCAG